MKVDIAIRMSELDSVPDILIKSISTTLMGRIAAKGITLGGVKAVADMLKNLNKIIKKFQIGRGGIKE